MIMIKTKELIKMATGWLLLGVGMIGTGVMEMIELTIRLIG